LAGLEAASIVLWVLAGVIVLVVWQPVSSTEVGWEGNGGREEAAEAAGSREKSRRQESRGLSERFMASKGRRVAFYVVMAAIAVYIIVSAATDPSGWFEDGSLNSYLAVVAAPVILVLIGRWMLRELRERNPPLDKP
jgi:hypothetical protein